MKTEINPGYGWILCKHGDPDREEYSGDATVWSAYGDGRKSKDGGPFDYFYRKRPLAPDGRKFSDPACEWEIVPEGATLLEGDHYLLGLGEWARCFSTIGSKAEIVDHLFCFARRRTAQSAEMANDPWIRFAHRKPVEGDYPIVCMTRNKNTSAFDNPPSYAWHKIWHSWRSIGPLPVVKSDAELAWEKACVDYPEGQELKTQNGKKIYLLAYAAGKEAK